MEHKTIEELKKMNDARLLAYFRMVRQKTQAYISSFYCDCCGELNTANWGGTEAEIQRDHDDMAIAQAYQDLVKAELKTRGHVEKRNKKK